MDIKEQSQQITHVTTMTAALNRLRSKRRFLQNTNNNGLTAPPHENL